MKRSDFAWIMSAVYVTPHLNEYVAAGCALTFFALAMYHEWHGT